MHGGGSTVKKPQTKVSWVGRLGDDNVPGGIEGDYASSTGTRDEMAVIHRIDGLAKPHEVRQVRAAEGNTAALERPHDVTATLHCERITARR